MRSAEEKASADGGAPTRHRLRPAGIGFAAAGLLILTSALFPRVDDPGDPDRFLAVLADAAARTRFVLLAVPLGCGCWSSRPVRWSAASPAQPGCVPGSMPW